MQQPRTHTLLIVVVFILSSSSAAQAQRSESNGLYDDIQFDVPELVAQYAYPSRTVTLEAFKVRNRTGSEHPKWVSIGYPTIVNDSDGQYFHFTPEYVSVQISTLDQKQKEALMRQAKVQYPNAVITLDSIIPLPLAKFTCRMNFYINRNSFELLATVYDLSTNPLALRFSIHEDAKSRALLRKRLQSSEPLFLECDAAATGKQEKVNTLKITIEEMRRLSLADKLLGPADEKYVARAQLSQLAQEVVANMHIEENYEMDGEAFSEEFIQKLLDSSINRFQLIPIDDALVQLSKFGIPMNQADLAPDVIKREMSRTLQVKTIGDRRHVISLGTGSDRNVSSVTDSLNGNAGIKIGLWPFDADLKADIAFVEQKSNEWAKNTSMLEDQLADLNQNSTSDIEWAVEGTRLIPKYLNVAKVTRMTLNRQLSFHRIRRKVTDAKYTQRYEVSINFRNLGSSPTHLQLLAVTTEVSQGASQQSVVEELRSLQRSVAELRSQLNDATTTTCVNKTTSGGWSYQLRISSQVYFRIKNIDCENANYYLNNIEWINWHKANDSWMLHSKYWCCPTSSGSCIQKDTERRGSSGGLFAGQEMERFAIKHLDCGGPEWYVNDIFWSNWSNITNSQNDWVWVLNANYRCCKRGK